MSGIIAGVADNDRGIAGASYNARIIPVRIADLQGYYDAYDSAEALHYLMRLEEPPDVINMSYGSDSMNIIELTQINEAIQQKGITCVAAAGNYSREQIESGDTGSYCYPASYEGVISVGAVTGDNQHCDFSYVNDSLDVCALGIGVFSTTDPSSDFGQGRLYASSYVLEDSETGEDVDCSIAGTSFAAPQVSAASALLKALHQDWKLDQIKSCLEKTAKDLGAPGRDDEYGYGLLDAAAAVGWRSSPSTYSDPYNDPLRERGLLNDE